METKKTILIGCGTLLGVVFILILIGIIWLITGPEGGVRLPIDMEEYALEYLDTHKILEDSEELLAYYDVTVSLDGSEAAILTTKRVIYHKNGRNNAMNLADVEDIQHRKETLIGDIFEISTASGKTMKIEIAPLNQGETFKNVLMKAWERAKKQDQDSEPGNPSN
jgi:hypothetical protein